MRARVWNDNKETDWKEKFKGDDVVIKSGSFIEMEFYEAHDFKGQYSPINKRGDGTQDPKSFKMIRVEKINPELEEISADLKCNLGCKDTFKTEGELLKHSEKMHADRMVVDEEAEATIKRKPGRPKAEKTA